MQGHGGKFSCLFCEGERQMKLGKHGKMRTFGIIRKRHRQFLESGGKLKDAQKFANCINEPLLDEDDDTLGISIIPPGELHLLIGVVDVHRNILIKMYGLEFVEALGRTKCGAMRHGYQGMKCVNRKKVFPEDNKPSRSSHVLRYTLQIIWEHDYTLKRNFCDFANGKT